MHHTEARYGCSKWPHIIWLFTTLLRTCKLVPLQRSFPQALRPLSNQTTLLYLQRSLARLLMRPDLGCLSTLITTLPGFLAPAVPQALCEAARGNRHCGQRSPIPWRLLFHYDHESPGSRTQNLRCSCVFHALKFHIFAVPHESLGRVIDKQELFKGEQLKWSREWRNWFRKKD